MPAGEQIGGVNFLRRERSKGDVFQTAAAAIQKKNEEDAYVFLQVLLPSFLSSFVSYNCKAPSTTLWEEEEEPDFPTAWLEATTALLRSFPKARQEIRMHS
jgi:hypothetical protein